MYYVPPTKNSISKGKLVDKQRNLIRILRKYDAYPKSSRTKKARLDKPPSEVPATVKASQAWLKNNSEPFTEVLAHWEKTYELRKGFADLDIKSIFEEWPSLMLPEGPSLVSQSYMSVYFILIL